MKIGTRIRELREENNLSMKELGKKIEVSDAASCKWENGIAEPKASYLERLSLFFSVSADYLIGRTDDLGAVLPSQQPALPILNDNEKQLIALYRSMNEPQKIRFLAFGEGITSARDKKYMS